jgi:hypothetical protein
MRLSMSNSIAEKDQVRLLLLSLTMLLIAPASYADWQYTRWGMTPEQVVAASGGKIELLPDNKRPRLPPLMTAATGEFQDGSLQLRTVFSFSTEGGGLQCVSYGVRSHDDDEAFKTALTKRYGPPTGRSGMAFLGQENLEWKTATDEISASFSKDDPAYVMQCARGK